MVEVEWLATDGVGPEDWTRLEGLLDDAERRRAAGFRFARDRHAYVGAHALVRCMLSRHAGVRPGDWRFEADAFGRPEIAPGHGAPPLRFNLSHARGMAAAAVTVGNDVGIDVESVERAAPSPAFVHGLFAAPEVEHLAALSGDEWKEAFYGIWTLKEALLKALGRGLSVSLDTFAIALDPIEVRFTPRLPEDPARWLLRRLRPSPAHRLALALRHPARERVTVTGRAAALDDMVR